MLGKVVSKLILFVVVTLILTLITVPYFKDSQAYFSDANSIWNKTMALIPSERLQNINVLEVAQEVAEIARPLPRNITEFRAGYEQIKKVADNLEQAVNNTNVEQLTLQAPRDLNLGEVVIGKKMKQPRKIGTFEIIDTRGGKQGWKLSLAISQLKSDDRVIASSTAELNLTDSPAGVKVKKGNPVIIEYASGQAEYSSRIKIEPELLVYVHKQIYTGEYKGTIESSIFPL